MFRPDWLLEPEIGRVAVLSEHEAEAGDLLWRVLHLVRTWIESSTDGESRLDLWPPLEREDRYQYLRPVAAGLGLLDQLVRDPDAAAVTTDEERQETIANTASMVAGWLEARGASATALAYAQIAAAVQPTIPWNAYHVGRLARRVGEPRHAVSWFRRAGQAAILANDAYIRVVTLEGIGHVHRAEGRLGRARSYYRRGFDCARQHNLGALAGDMLADLSLVELETGDFAAATHHWDWALQLYESGDPRISHLARDVAWLLMDRYGAFETTFFVFDELLNHIRDPPYRLLLYAHRARAAAGARLYDDFEASWIDAFALLRDSDTIPHTPAAALIELGRGAVLARQLPRARFALAQAASVARKRRDDPAAAEADRLLHVVSNRAVFFEERGARSTHERLPSPEQVEHLCTSAVARLESRDRGELFSPAVAFG